MYGCGRVISAYLNLLVWDGTEDREESPPSPPDPDPHADLRGENAFFSCLDAAVYAAATPCRLVQRVGEINKEDVGAVVAHGIELGLDLAARALRRSQRVKESAGEAWDLGRFAVDVLRRRQSVVPHWPFPL